MSDSHTTNSLHFHSGSQDGVGPHTSYNPQPQKDLERPTKIVCVSSTTGFGGTERHLIDLIRRLDPTKNEVSIHCLKSDPYTEHFADRHGLPLTIYKHTEPFTFIRAWRTFAREKADVIVFVNGRLGAFSGKIYLAAKLSGNARIVAIEHLTGPVPPPKKHGLGGLVNPLRGLFKRDNRYLIHVSVARMICDATICVSHAVRKRLMDGYGYSAAKTITVWNGVDTKQFRHSERLRSVVRQELKVDPEETLLLCVARLAPEKGIDTLLQALKTLNLETLRCKCVIVGDGPQEQELLQERDRLGLSSSVQFAGFSSDVKPYYSAADIFVLPSRNEGLPLVLIEAMAMGLPCVATNVGGNSEIISHGDNGFIVAPESATSLAAALKQLACNKQLREEMQVHAKMTACRLFDVNIAMGKIMDILGVQANEQDASVEVSAEQIKLTGSCLEV